MRGGWTKLQTYVSGFFLVPMYVSFEKKPIFSPESVASKSLRFVDGAAAVKLTHMGNLLISANCNTALVNLYFNPQILDG